MNPLTVVFPTTPFFASPECGGIGGVDGNMIQTYSLALALPWGTECCNIIICVLNV